MLYAYLFMQCLSPPALSSCNRGHVVFKQKKKRKVGRTGVIDSLWKVRCPFYRLAGHWDSGRSGEEARRKVKVAELSKEESYCSALRKPVLQYSWAFLGRWMNGNGFYLGVVFCPSLAGLADEAYYPVHPRHSPSSYVPLGHSVRCEIHRWVMPSHLWIKQSAVALFRSLRSASWFQWS